MFKKEQLRRDKLTLQYELDIQKAQDDKDAAKIQAEKELNARFKKYLDGFEKRKGADEANPLERFARQFQRYFFL